MSRSRRYALSGIVIVLAAVAAVILRDVLATVFLAVTVAAVCAPLYRRLVARGVPEWWASAVTTTVAFSAVVAVFAPLVGVLYRRREQLIGLIQDLPSSVTFDVLGFQRVVRATEVRDALVGYVGDAAVNVLGATPVLGIKLALFAFVVFGLLLGQDRAYSAVVGTVPPEYRGVVEALHARGRSILFAIYVLQAATAAGTFVIAAAVFALLGYSGVLTLAAVAGILQFLPVVGPSVLIALLVIFELAAGDVAAAVLVGLFGAVFIGYLPDVLIRARLARRSADMPSTLYFTGFTGGLLSLGPIGIIAGPLAVALLVEGMELLSEETGVHRQSTLSDADASAGSSAPGGATSSEEGASPPDANAGDAFGSEGNSPPSDSDSA
ncbi:AI-2E family transporter [Halostella sp. JP-L12]|uniref:AI-2E family transporter n=1 Tax=Halostella TaxID=1843185 RepID=UPI000EF76BF2|nr:MULTISPECIES: AI-2E family transporter [Halostella]NHN46208.1 AI-2E family transporter [Halostella sp. JP-L12]